MANRLEERVKDKTSFKLAVGAYGLAFTGVALATIGELTGYYDKQTALNLQHFMAYSAMPLAASALVYALHEVGIQPSSKNPVQNS